MTRSDLLQCFQQHAEALRRFLTRRLHCAETAADLTHDLYLRLARLDPSDAIDHPRAYVFQVAEHLAMDHLRRRARYLRRYAGTPSDTVPCAAPPPERAVDTKQQCDILRQAIADLPPKCRTVFLLHKVNQMSYGEIAAALHISPKTVEKHMSKALAHCRDRLQRTTSSPSPLPSTLFSSIEHPSAVTPARPEAICLGLLPTKNGPPNWG